MGTENIINSMKNSMQANLYVCICTGLTVSYYTPQQVDVNIMIVNTEI